jgi:hypothetical protein
MRKIVEKINENRWFYLGLFVIILFSGVLRLWHLGTVPFVADEFLDVNATYGYHKTGQWQAWDFNRGDVSVRDNDASDERSWLYRIQVATLYNYFPPTETTVRFTSALWGIVTTLILYFVTLHFTRNRWIALIAAFLWAVSVPAIEINRKIRMYSMFAPIFLLFSWSVFQLIDAKRKNAWENVERSTKEFVRRAFDLKWAYLIPIMIFGALSYHLHPLTGNIVLVLFVYFVAMAVYSREKITAKRYMTYATLMIIGAVCVFFVVPKVWREFMSSLVFFEDHWSYIGHILRTYWHPLIGAVLILIGSWFLITQREDERPGIWIVSTFFTILFAAIFLWNRNVGAQYIFFVQSFGVILAAAGGYYLIDLAQKNIIHKKTFLIGLLCIVLFAPYYGYFFLENNTYNITAEGEQPNYRKVFDYVKRNARDGDIMITRNFRNYYWSGLDIAVLDFGSERSEEDVKKEGKVLKVTRENVEDIVSENPRGWVVYSDNDTNFITKEAQAYFDENFEKVTDSPLVRGTISVYKWGE